MGPKNLSVSDGVTTIQETLYHGPHLFLPHRGGPYARGSAALAGLRNLSGGASAVESEWRDVHDPNLRVFVLCEPVLVTDWHAPGAGALGRVPDSRVTQFWHPGRALSQAIGHGHVVWDFVARIQPRGSGVPVVRVIGDLRLQLSVNGPS